MIGVKGNLNARKMDLCITVLSEKLAHPPNIGVFQLCGAQLKWKKTQILAFTSKRKSTNKSSRFR